MQGARQGGTVGKPRGLKPGAVKPKPAPTRKGRKSKVDAEKVIRVASRVNSVVNRSDREGVKKLNSIEVASRAKSFLRKKSGPGGETVDSVAKAIKTRRQYSTATPNRNKPLAYDGLGQRAVRAKAQRDAMSARQRIAEFNSQQAAKSAKPPSRLLSRREIANKTQGLGSTLGQSVVRAPSQANTIRKPRSQSGIAAPSQTSTRSIRTAKAQQRARNRNMLAQTGYNNPSVTRHRSGGIRRTGTGMAQTSLMGKSKPLYSYKPRRGRRSYL
jgi:hypothetical protein